MTKRHFYFLSHLFLSFFLIISIFLVIFYLWYPIPLAEATGVLKIFVIILCIDIIVGPILSLLVYKEGKKSLKFDLTIIVFIQVLALILGVLTIEKGRPIWLVFNIDRFEVIKKNEVILLGEKDVLPQFLHTGLFGRPQFSAIQRPHLALEQSEEFFQEVFGGVSSTQLLERYVPLENLKSQIQQRSQDLQQLYNFNNQADVNKILKKYPEANAWLPLKASHQDMVVLMNKEQAKVIQIVNLRPWS